MGLDDRLRGYDRRMLDELEKQIHVARERLAPENYGAMEAQRPMTVSERVQKIFQYHDDPAKIPNYVAIRTAAKNLAEIILQNSPPCADQTRALNHVRDAVMVANAAVALDGTSFH